MNTREFSSVPTRIRGYVRRMDSASDLPMLQEQLSAAEDDALDLSGVKLQEPLVRFLEAVNAKLDTLLGLMSVERLESEFDSRIEIVEISGSGLGFTCADCAFAVGDRLEFALLLAQFPFRVAAAVGKVTQVRTVNERPVWNVTFTSVRESDQEAIVRFVFREERERIREKKWAE
ncbi:hypothetical protein GGQ74_000504 [Desulfobaculum xiamenense]|uniref:PilZ domain-containing protein n=1 Tax=Desulfobaculum xiamenense TaxID=995050 RepID=A0A846QNR5_9BACT|nr:PilZ domain-containing protein [Desulfobaculum xiamenense]NJB66864.1 hypothetical protein [Desulfobaculum xiamenense]